MKIEDRVIAITGASAGIGATTARLLAARVAVVESPRIAVGPQPWDEVTAAVQKAGGQLAEIGPDADALVWLDASDIDGLTRALAAAPAVVLGECGADMRPVLLGRPGDAEAVAVVLDHVGDWGGNDRPQSRAVFQRLGGAQVAGRLVVGEGDEADVERLQVARQVFVGALAGVVDVAGLRQRALRALVLLLCGLMIWATVGGYLWDEYSVHFGVASVIARGLMPPEHPLCGLPNVLLTPHMAGYGPHLNDRRLQIIEDNCKAFAEGRPLRNIVDKSNWF